MGSVIYAPLGGVPAKDIECANKVATLVTVGGATRLVSIPTALFGGYKLMKGRGATGVTAMAGAVVMFFLGGAIVSAAAASFEACRKA